MEPNRGSKDKIVCPPLSHYENQYSWVLLAHRVHDQDGGSMEVKVYIFEKWPWQNVNRVLEVWKANNLGLGNVYLYLETDEPKL